MRTMGTVRWFDRATATGCAISEGGTQSTFNLATLEPFGLSEIDAGVALIYDMKLEAGRLIVATIYEIAGKGSHPQTTRNPPSAASAPAPRRVKGRVQWFDRAKGYGFIVSRDLAGDVLFHRSLLEAIGVDSILDEAVVDCEVEQKVRGLQAKRILAVLAPDAPSMPPAPSGATAPGVSAELQGVHMHKRHGSLPRRDPSEYPGFEVAESEDAPMLHAVCRWFSRPKGYGFVEVVGGSQDVFIHMDTLRRCGVRDLRQGQRVQVRVRRTENGVMATEITEGKKS